MSDVTWRGMRPSAFIFDEMIDYVSGPYRPVEPPVPTMAEINSMIARFQAQNRRAFPPPFEPTPEQVSQAMQERLAKHDAEQQLLGKIRFDVLSVYDLQERQIAVTPRTYQERKQRRKKAAQ